MKVKGILKEIFCKGEYISLLLNIKKKDVAEAKEWINTIQDKEIDVSLEEHRDKRSLNANAYFHVLNGKIAECMGLSKIEAKNILLARYGQYETLDGEPLFYKTKAPPEYMAQRGEIHTLYTGAYTKRESTADGYIDYTEYEYLIYRGSHTYNTKEMATLIRGTVEEAKELGIETLTPQEIERLIKAWKG